jgi:hypothetical protein
VQAAAARAASLALALPAYFLHGLLDVDGTSPRCRRRVPDRGASSSGRQPAAPAAGVHRAHRERSCFVGFSLVAVWLGARWSDQALPPSA